MTYEGIRGQVDDEHFHLGGNCVEGDPYTYSPGVWNYLINRFCISSVLDVGSGLGHCAEYFFRKNIRTIALDGLWSNIKDSLYPTVQWDIIQGSFKTKVDLVHCQEVAEHIDPQYVQNLIDTFKCGRYICMTHAIPDQPGHHHVNCQPMEYWVELMKENNCYLLDEDTKRIKQIATKDESEYLKSSALLFCNRDF